MKLTTILSAIPSGLRNPLLEEYNSIIQNYLEQRWTASELSGGKICEIVYSILDGHAKGTYAPVPFKPRVFVDACRALEKNSHVPRSFQILIPRILPALFEIRNNRNVGHVGGDVDPNFMDSQAVVSMAGWIMGEIIRVFHNTTTRDAQKAVDIITSRKLPLVWDTGEAKRILDPSISLKHQILMLISSSPTKTKVDDLFEWIENKDRAYFMITIRKLHTNRLLELSKDQKEVQILPPGTLEVEKQLAKLL